MIRTRCAALLLLALLVGCDGVPTIDTPDAGGSTPEAPAPPAPVTLPSRDCPSGWLVVPIESGHACAPWETLPTCEAGELLSPGAGCVPLATDCGTDTPPELDDTMALVVPGAASGGDGSRARPYARLSDAIGAGHTRVALAPGEHVLERGPPADLTLIGTCPTNTMLSVPAIVELRGVSLIRRVRVTGDQIGVPPGASLTLESVELASMYRSVEVQGTLTGRRVAVRDATESGILGLDPESIVLEDVSFERMPTGLWVGPDGSDVVEPHAAVTVTRAAASQIADVAFQGAALVSFALSEIAVEGTAGGVLSGARSFVLHDAFFRALTQTAVGTRGGAPDVDLAGVRVVDSPSGMILYGGTFEAEDITGERAGITLWTDGARGHLARFFAHDASTYAIQVTGGDVTIEDAWVDGVTATSNNTGSALAVSSNAHVTLTRARLSRTQHVGMGAVAAVLEASDLVLRDVTPIDVEDGCGALALEGATLRLLRTRIEQVAGMGVRLEGSSASLEDVAITDVAASVGDFGLGVYLVGSATSGPGELDLVRVSIERTHRVGVLVAGTGATLNAIDVSVAETAATVNGGIAFAVIEGATARTQRFLFRGSELAGVLLTAGVDAEFARGRIEANPFGVLADPDLSFNTDMRPGYRLEDVDYVGNELDHQPSRLSFAPPNAIEF